MQRGRHVKFISAKVILSSFPKILRNFLLLSPAPDCKIIQCTSVYLSFPGGRVMMNIVLLCEQCLPFLQDQGFLMSLTLVFLITSLGTQTDIITRRSKVSMTACWSCWIVPKGRTMLQYHYYFTENIGWPYSPTAMPPQGKYS